MGIKKSIQSNKTTIYIFLYLLSVTVLIYYLFSNWAYDDPFITYRYARNIANGLGFVYNPNEFVQSTTTPLFSLLLAVLYPIWADLPRLAILIGSFSLALGAVFLWVLAQSWQSPLVGWISLLLYPSFPLLLSTLGSETPTYLAFCLGGFAFYSRRNYNLSAIFAALAVLTRPDGALIPIILAADYLIRIRRPIPWKPILIFFILTLPWFIFAWGYFGSPIPVTMAAKQHQGSMTISQGFAPGLLTTAKPYFTHWFYWLEAALAIMGFVYMVLRARRWLLFLAWVAFYFLAFSLLGVSRYFWYYAPLIPGFIILVGLGITAIAFWGDLLLHHFNMKRDRIQQFPSHLATVIILLLAVSIGVSTKQLLARTDSRRLVYRAIGEWIHSNTPEGASIATLEVGIIGYYAQRPIIGFAGLIQPEVGDQLNLESTYEDAALWAVEEYRPDYLVLQTGHFPRLVEGYVSHYCTTVQHFPGESYRYGGNLSIYSCKDE